MPAPTPRRALLFLSLFLAVFSTTPIKAVQNLTLQWDPSSSTDVVAYRLYYGSASRVYSQSVQVAAPATSATASGLVEGSTYFFAVTAVNSAGMESGFSSEISSSISAIVNAVPTLNPLNTIVVTQNAGPTPVPLSGITSGSPTESQFLTVSATSSNPWLVPTPSISYSSPASTGTLTFTPTPNMAGSATITVSVNDGQLLNNLLSRSFSVLVNNPPTLNALPNISLTAGAAAQTVTLSGITSGAANESQPLQVTATSSNPWLIPTPVVLYTSPNATGTLTFTPTAGMTGSAVITVTVNDGQAGNNTTSKSFTVTVNPAAPVNVAPTLNAISNYVFTQNPGTVFIPLSGITTGSSTEIQTLTVSAVSSNPALIPNPTVSYTSPNATGSLVLSAAANSSGSATITVTVSDGQSVNSTITRTFSVLINNPPTLAALTDLTLNQNAGAQNIPLTGITSGASGEAQALVVSATSSNPSVVPNPVVSYASPSSTGSLTFQPVAGAVGSSVITVTVNDGQSANNTVTRSFNVTVNAPPPNTPPTLNAIANVVVAQNSGATVVPLSGITSGSPTEVQPLSVTAVSSNPWLIPNPVVSYSSPNSTGTLTFTPVANSSGSATITVTVSDGQALNSTVTRTFVVTVNNPPTLNAINNISLVQNAPVQTVNFSGVTSGAANEAQPLIVTAISSNPGVIPTPTTVYTSPSSTGYLLLQPLAGAVGSSVITVSVSDGQPGNNFTSGTFTVTVNAPAPNVPPTLNPISNVLLAQNAGTIFVSLGGISSGSPTEVQPLTVTATSSNPALIPNPTVSYSSPSSSGTLAFTPAANSSGTATITVTVNDGQSANNLISRSFVVTINSPPTLNPIPSMSVAVGSAWNVISLYGISAGGVGEVQPITVTASSSNTGLIPNPAIYYSSPNPNGALSFATVAGVSGTATITVTVKDGQTGNGVTTRAFVVTVGSTSGALSALSVPNGDGSAPDESTADTASGQDAAAGADVAGAEAVSPTAESAAAVPVPTADPADITSTTVSASSDAAADVPVSSVASTEPKPLEISNIVVSSSDARTLDITWQTDRPATCLMAYGATAALRWGGASSSGTEHTIHLANLEPATLYYLRVLGADAAGNFAVSDLSSAQTPGVNVLSWPAQSATLSEPMALGQDLDGTGDSFISAPDAGQGTASFNMQIPDGMVYRIWCRVLAPSGGSVGISLDGTAEAFASVPAAAGDWHWVLLESGSGPFTFLANGGFHQLTFRTFAPDVWVERVCISNDPEWRPLGFDSPVLSVSSLAGKVALLEWTDRWSNAEGYVVEASTGGGEYQTLTTVESSVRSLRVAITDASTSYRIYAFAAGDRGPSSAPVTLAQSSDQAPNAPQNLTGTITDDGTVSLNWQNGSAPQTGIVIERSIDQINFSTVQTLPGDATAVTDTPPGPGKYFYRAKGVNAATQSDPTDVITVIF